MKYYSIKRTVRDFSGGIYRVDEKGNLSWYIYHTREWYPIRSQGTVGTVILTTIKEQTGRVRELTEGEVFAELL